MDPTLRLCRNEYPGLGLDVGGRDVRASGPQGTLSRCGRLVAVAVVALVVLGVGLTQRAAAFVYWANANTNSIGIATLDGSRSNPRFIATGGRPTGIAVDSKYIYWTAAPYHAIGRATLDGTQIDPNFMTVEADYFTRLAVNSLYLYWVSNFGVDRANIDGSGKQGLLSNYDLCAGVSGVALDGSYMYVTLLGLEAANYCRHPAVGRGGLDGSSFNSAFLPLGSEPNEVAVDPTYLFWTHGSTIGRARIDGTSADPQFLSAAVFNSGGLADDGQHIYWAESAWIGRANLDGTGVQRHFVSASYPNDIAVDQRAGPLPAGAGVGGGNGGSAGKGGKRAGCIAPKLTGLSLTAAIKKLRKAHCQLGAVKRRKAKRARRNRVIGQSARPGRKLASGSKVGVTVGK